MPRHGLEIVRDENAIIRSGQSQHVGIGYSLQVGIVCGEKVDSGLPFDGILRLSTR